MGTYRKIAKKEKVSLSCKLFVGLGNGIGRHVIFRSAAPDEYYEKVITHEQLRTALATLPEKQRQRIYAHFVFGFSKAQIARAEGVDHRAISLSIQRGLCKLERYLKNIF